MKLGHLIIFVSSCLATGIAQNLAFVYPSPEGTTNVTLVEGSPAETDVLTVVLVGIYRQLKVEKAWEFSNTGNVVTKHFTFANETIIKTTRVLDYENVASYTILLKARSPDETAFVEFRLNVRDINDETPELSPDNVYNVTWDEGREPGDVFTSFDVIDDANDTHYFNLTGAHASHFALQSSTGAIRIRDTLDREGINQLAKYTELYLTATDAMGRTSVAKQLTVIVGDINDNAPFCSNDWYNVEDLAENSGPGTTIIQIQGCTDDDIGVNGEIDNYVIASGDDQATKFQIRDGSLQTTNRELNYEAKQLYNLVINVIDGGTPPLTGTVSVRVKVGSVNEFDPEWERFDPRSDTYTYTVLENAPLQTSVVTLAGSDRDLGKDGEIEFLLLDNFENGVRLFAVNKITGVLETRALLDADAGITSYTVQVRIQDKGDDVRSKDLTLTINIEDINDSPPEFSATSYSATIPEGDARRGEDYWAGIQLSATDRDPDSGAMTYSIVQGDPLKKFQFRNDIPGLITLRNSIEVDEPTRNPHQYTLIVTVSDRGIPNKPELYGTATVTITISPLTNDFDPVFTLSAIDNPVTIAELEPVDLSVATLAVTDQDMDHGQPQVITYSIAGGNTDNDFAVDPVYGKVSTAQILDYERSQLYELVIIATDSGAPQRTATLTLTVHVSNVNEQAPTCLSYNIVVMVNEEAGFQPNQIKSIKCSDDDEGDVLKYNLTTVNPKFKLNTTTGAVSTVIALDYEEASSHKLIIEVTDSLPPTFTATVTLTAVVRPINEHAPEFDVTFYSTVLQENVPEGTSVITVNATDLDEGAWDSRLRYTITSGNGLGAFVINSSTGLISTSGVGLDRESGRSHNMTVRATDDVPGSPTERSAEVIVLVDVANENDNVPICTPFSYQVSITEPSVIGATVVKMTAIDDDDDDDIGTPTSLSFQITDGDTDNVFGINGDSVVLAQLVNYETKKTHALTITLSDGGSPPLSSTCRVDVTIISAGEFPPVLSEPNHATNLSELTAIGTIIYSASATDPDVGTGSVVTYSIISGNDDNCFYCYADSGNVIVWNQLDYDTPPTTYNLTLQALDDSGLNDTLWLFIELTDANDQAPVFQRNVYTIVVDENVPIGSVVGSVVAEDNDGGVSGSLIYANISGNALSRFAIDPDNGNIFTITDIDRESRRDYSLIVSAADSGSPPQTATAVVDISVRDLNDNAPQFILEDFTVSLSEAEEEGVEVATVTAVDADSAASNNVFTYILDDPYFAVNTSGAIYLKEKLDRETQAIHVLLVLAPDSGTPAQTGTATVTVLVDDINDNRPDISGPYHASVTEDASIGHSITQVIATDADTGDNARLTYKFVRGNRGDVFKIGELSGIIQVKRPLKSHSSEPFRLVVKVNDSGDPWLTATTVVHINFTDVNDNAPIFERVNYAFKVREHGVLDAFVGQVKATDDDEGINAVVAYRFFMFWTGNEDDFYMVEHSGYIRTAAILDRERTPQYIATVRAFDAGVPQLFTDINITIAVEDINDNPPKFDRRTYHVRPRENDPVDTGVVTVTVTDDDTGVNGDVVLSIDTSTVEGARADQFFKVTSGSGVVTVKQVIDRENDTDFTFTIIAVDRGVPPMTSSATVSVTVVDVNEAGPVFEAVYYNTEIAYSGQCTKSIVAVKATDSDSGLNGQVTYFLQSSTQSDLFLINAVSGELTIRSILQDDTTYLFNVSARDGGDPPMISAIPALIRIDGLDPSTDVLTFKLGITVDTFLANQAEFLKKIQVVVRDQYPTAVAKLWCAQTRDGGFANVHVYFLNDNSTELYENRNLAKFFISQAKSRGLFTSDVDGEPGSILQDSTWSQFDIESVQPFSEDQEAWERTTEGIAVISACSFVGIGLLISSSYMIFRFSRHLKRQPGHKVFVEERKPPGNRNHMEVHSGPTTPKTRIFPVNKPFPMIQGPDDDFFWKN